VRVAGIAELPNLDLARVYAQAIQLSLNSRDISGNVGRWQAAAIQICRASRAKSGSNALQRSRKPFCAGWERGKNGCRRGRLQGLRDLPPCRSKRRDDSGTARVSANFARVGRAKAAGAFAELRRYVFSTPPQSWGFSSITRRRSSRLSMIWRGTRAARSYSRNGRCCARISDAGRRWAGEERG
jgi:hypothetical protein